MVKLRRKQLVMVLVWLPCLRMIDIFRELYRVSRYVVLIFMSGEKKKEILAQGVESNFKVFLQMV